MDHPTEAADRAASASSLQPAAVTLDLSCGQTVTLPVIEESLVVEKVEVDRGGYRISKRVEVHQQMVDELLRHERVDIERRAIGRALTGDAIPEARYEGDTLIVPVIEEVIVTEKRLMLVEEVRITRIHGTHQDPQQYTLRKEQIEIERLGADIQVIRSSSPPSDGQPNDLRVTEPP